MPIRLGRSEACQRTKEGLLGWAVGGALGAACARGERVDGGLPGTDQPPAPCTGLSVAAALLPDLDGARLPETTAQSLAASWTGLLTLPGGSYGFALRNLGWGLSAPVTGWFRNPCATDSSAVERALLWGMLAPAAPGEAAWLAHADATIDHAEDGALGAMFVAALGAAGYAESDPLRLVAIAAGVLPSGSELLECVGDLRRARKRSHPWVEAYQVLAETLGHLPADHAYQTAGRIALSLLYGADWTTHLNYAADCGGAVGTTLAVVGGIVGVCGAPEFARDAYRAWIGPAPIATPGVACEPAEWADLAAAIVERAAAHVERLGGAVELVDGETDLSQMDGADLAETGRAHEALTLDLGEVRVGSGELTLALQYQGPPTIASGGGKTLYLSVPGLAETEISATIRLEADGGLTVGPDRPQPVSSGAYLMVSARGKTVPPVTRVTASLTLEDGRGASLGFPLVAESCWWLCGPFDASGAEPMRTVREPERRLSTTATYEGRDRMRLRFRKVSFPDVRMELDDWVQALSGILYLVADLECPETVEARLRIAATGAAKVWLDGRVLVREMEAMAALSLDEATVAPVRLTSGRHRLMLKLMRAEAPLVAAVLLTDAEGRPLASVHSPGWQPLEQE